MLKYAHSVRVPRPAWVALLVCGGLAAVRPVSASLIDSLSTPAASGVISGDDWAPPPSGDGFRIDWTISQNPDGTWHYQYTFHDQGQGTLTPANSHLIIQLSENITSSDLFNVTGDVDEVTFGTFGPHPSNPSFPAGESIFGVKFDLTGSQTTVAFDSTRQPMWGDFYSKGGRDSFAYNASLGVDVANPDAYNATPLSAAGDPLSKILVPDTMIPEPGSLALAALAAGALPRRRRSR